ncbi:CPCC family cysteine-rich protein [Bacillus nitratireducens]|uniref:CPCC family cysteine-rich protein n=1 Tax=Bacillus nitratireducens TaxID=2026193 RepID=A0ABU6PLV8_9BACI|nr:CPCC family cysteine-rich protein [Bacillus nitratireducens]MDR4171232.1 hypothetical protein [Bacillus nitratireducens]MED4681816.1 CPCC family cysteine-rich protein [Bacillus nitratireducens]OSX89309.1 hypothetical protein BTJ45_04952 [Bacillus mycoides]
MKYTCPCCGYKTLEEEPPGTFDICSICFWEDDNVQFDDPDYEGGANEESLRQYQKVFLMRNFNRKLTGNNERDPNWRPLFEK